MTRMIRTLTSIGCVTGLGLVAASAAAQAPAPAPAPVAVAPAPVAMAPAAAPVGLAPAGDSDQGLWVGRLGIGWYGTRSVPLRDATLTGDTFIDTPVVGVRYWINPMIGIDGGLGFFMTGGSTSTDPGGLSRDKESKLSFVLHAGVPIALLNMKHYSFQITPELDFGIANSTVKPLVNPGTPPANINTDTTYGGMLIQLGARAGAEVFFGFIGLPQLSLDASVGLFLASRSGKQSGGTPPATPQVTIKDSALTIGTAQIHSPWDIFRENVAARYYF
jgi:hypothetical protein